MDNGDVYTCAICAELVSDDPRWARVNLSWDQGDGATQQFGVHMECLRSVLYPNFPLYDGLD